MSTTSPARGEVWMVDFDPIRGHEQAGRRPALVVSVDAFNNSPAELVVVLPLTSKAKGIRSHVEVNPQEAGVTVKSFIKCEDIRSVAKERLFRRRGSVSSQTLAAVEYRLRILLRL
jgi:mRNA interferase MazF